MFSRPDDHVQVRIKPLHQVGVRRMQAKRLLALAAPHMNNHAARKLLC